MSQPWDYIAKLVCIGDSGTGKSSLTIRLCEGRFSPHHDVTIGVEFGSRIVAVGPPASNLTTQSSLHSTQSSGEEKQKRMKLSLWDTAGQETYKSITRSYFRGASGALLVYDITRRSTFEHATAWLHDLRQIAEEGIVVILVGNKSDLASSNSVTSGTMNGESQGLGTKNQRAVTIDEAEDWCKKNGVMTYVETSARSGQNVEKAFLEVAERIYENVERGRYDLNDRRSGVRGPGAAGKGSGGTVRVAMTDNGGGKGSRGWGGGCC